MKMVSSEIARYAAEHTTEESELLKELVAYAEVDLEHVDMLSGRVVGRFLALLISICGAKRVLEIGTFVGYSALCMAEALPEKGQLITCEYNQRYEELARNFFSQSEAGGKIKLVMGNALETIPTLNGTFDFVFLDADKINYPRYYDLLIPIIRPNGLLIIDNTFWNGTVLNADDEKGRAIDRLNKKIKKDKQVEQVMLTVRDGLLVVRKQ